MSHIILQFVAAAAFTTSLQACVTSGDPADGGFANGIAGVSSGSYNERVAEREAQVAAAETQNQSLNQQYASLKSQHTALKYEIIERRSQVTTAGVQIPPDVEAEVQKVLAAEPTSVDALSKAIADARTLSERLRSLAVANSK